MHSNVLIETLQALVKFINPTPDIAISSLLFINLYPNVKLLNYRLSEQLIDAVPTLLISLTMGIGICWIAFIDIPNWLMLLSQILSGIIIYIVLCLIFKDESFYYLLNQFKTYKLAKSK